MLNSIVVICGWTGKDAKKKKNKKKDVNNKGQHQQHGTDMDAYIVEVMC